MSDGSITAFIKQLRDGDEAAIDKLWDRYFPRLVGLALKSRWGKACLGQSAEDAAQSAMVSFWQLARRRNLPNAMNRDRLWNLLAQITKRKLSKNIRREQTQKRGGVRTRLAWECTDDGAAVPELMEALTCLPMHEMDLVCEELLEQLDDDHRQIALMRMLGYKNREIATELQCTERNVERKLQIIRLTWSRALDAMTDA